MTRTEQVATITAAERERQAAEETYGVRLTKAVRRYDDADRAMDWDPSLLSARWRTLRDPTAPLASPELMAAISEVWDMGEAPSDDTLRALGSAVLSAARAHLAELVAADWDEAVAEECDAAAYEDWMHAERWALP